MFAFLKRGKKQPSRIKKAYRLVALARMSKSHTKLLRSSAEFWKCQSDFWQKSDDKNRKAVDFWVERINRRNEEIEKAKLTIQELQEKVSGLETEKQAKNDSSVLTLRSQQRKVEEQMQRIANLFRDSDEALKEHVGVAVDSPDEENCNWNATTSYCSYGGCDMDIIEFNSERDARLFSAIMEVIEFKPTSGGTCSSCSAEYMRDCI